MSRGVHGRLLRHALLLGRTIQGEHLVDRLAPSDQVSLNQVHPCLGQCQSIHAQALHQGWIGVVAQALGVRHNDQEQIQCRGRVAAGVKVPVTDQP